MLLNYLKPMAIFATVVETGSFTQAGKRLNMPRGKVSEQVARLETYLQVKLLQRTTRQVTITTEGNALYQHAQQLLRSGVLGMDEVKSFTQEVKGTIRITTTHDYYEHLLLPILKKFNSKYPKVLFDLRITEQTLAIIDNSIDLAIRSGELPDSSLISLPLTTTLLKVYAGPEFRQQELLIEPNDLTKFNWIALGNGDQVNKNPITLTHVSGKQQSFTPVQQHAANSTASYCHLIEQNFGLGVMAEHTARVLVKQGRLMEVLKDWHHQSLPISLLYPARLHMATRTRLLVEEIRSAVKN